MMPVDGASEVPVGRVPDVTAKVYGAVPPAALMVSEYALPTVPPLSSAATGVTMKNDGA
jgi:hypothetical protein